jgi:hypothetical protein
MNLIKIYERTLQPSANRELDDISVTKKRYQESSEFIIQRVKWVEHGIVYWLYFVCILAVFWLYIGCILAVYWLYLCCKIHSTGFHKARKVSSSSTRLQEKKTVLLFVFLHLLQILKSVLLMTPLQPTQVWDHINGSHYVTVNNSNVCAPHLAHCYIATSGIAAVHQ